jgi:hypothetical protein
MNEIVRQETLNMEADVLAKARALTIRNNDDYRAADAISVGLLALEKSIKADFKPSKDAAFAAHKTIVAQEAAHLNKVSEARAIIRPKLMAFENEQRRIAAEEAKRREAIARKEAEDRAIAEAAEAEKQGDTATAEAIMEAPVVVAPVVVASELPKRQTRIPEAWTYEIVNEAIIPREWMEPSHTKLSGMARSTKGSVTVSGVRFFDKNAVQS